MRVKEESAENKITSHNKIDEKVEEAVKESSSEDNSLVSN